MDGDIHHGFRFGIEGKERRVDNGTKIMDHYSKEHIITELKPMNYRSVIKGIKQLKTYNALMGGTNKLVLIVY